MIVVVGIENRLGSLMEGWVVKHLAGLPAFLGRRTPIGVVGDELVLGQGILAGLDRGEIIHEVFTFFKVLLGLHHVLEFLQKLGLVAGVLQSVDSLADH